MVAVVLGGLWLMLQESLRFGTGLLDRLDRAAFDELMPEELSTFSSLLRDDSGEGGTFDAASFDLTVG